MRDLTPDFIVSQSAADEVLFSLLRPEPIFHEIADIFPAEFPTAVNINGDEFFFRQRMNLNPGFHQGDPGGQSPLIGKLLVIGPDDRRLGLLMHSKKYDQLVQKIVTIIHIVAQLFFASVQIKKQ